MYIKKVTNSATPVTAVVVDNLTSDSSTNALSAKQGKILNEKIENLNLSDLEGLTAVDSFPIGAIVPYGGFSAPENWMVCDGREISRTEYKALFDAIGTWCGQGDGSTTFNIPNLQGRVPVGWQSGDPDFGYLGNPGGEKTHTLTIDEIPPHNHAVNSFIEEEGATERGVAYVDNGRLAWYLYEGTAGVGGGQAHNNLQPYLTVTYIIKVKQGTVTGEEGLIATAPEIAIQNEEPTGQEVLWIEEDEGLIDSDNFIFEKNIMTITLASAYDCETQGAYTLITGFTLFSKIGSKLTFQDNKIIIGKGISKILVSGKMGWYNTQTGIKYAYIKCSEKNTMWNVFTVNAANTYNIGIFTPYVLDVNEGDEIYLTYYTTQTGDAIQAEGLTYLTVEVLE